jgi:HEAT repeat protein
MRDSPARRRPLSATLLACIALAAFPACAAQREQPARGEPEPFVPLPDEPPHPIGFFLTEFDKSLARWSQLELTSSSARDQNALSALEANMRERARERRDELLAVLEAGAPAQRRIAAAALGFARDPGVLGALLACLSERDPILVQKALLGLGVLAEPGTPLLEIRRILRDDPDAWTRNNAAFALLAIAGAGGASPELAEACRAALVDAEPGVRAQCASALGVLGDAGSTALLGELLFDPVNLVSLAAAASLASIGAQRAEQKGAAARLLAAALERTRPDRRARFLGALRLLSGRDLGEDSAPWLEWARRLP